MNKGTQGSKPIQPATPRRNYTAPLESDRCDARAVTALGGEGCRCMRRKIKGANVCSVHACNDYPRLLAERAELVAALRGLRAWCDANINGCPMEYGQRMEAADAILRKLEAK